MVRGSGAEGATAPEPLRHQGPQGDETLESSRGCDAIREDAVKLYPAWRDGIQ